MLEAKATCSPQKIPRCFQRSWMWLSDSSGCLLKGGLVLLERDFFCFVFFGVRRSEGRETSLMTDIPYNIAVWWVFLEATPIYIWHPQGLSKKESGQPFKSRVLQNVFSHETNKWKKNTQPSRRRRFSTKKVGRHLFPKRLFFPKKNTSSSEKLQEGLRFVTGVSFGFEG